MANVNMAMVPAAKKVIPTHNVASFRFQANSSIANGVNILDINDFNLNPRKLQGPVIHSNDR